MGRPETPHNIAPLSTEMTEHRNTLLTLTGNSLHNLGLFITLVQNQSDDYEHVSMNSPPNCDTGFVLL